MTVVCVLRSGGEYTAAHVLRLAKQVRVYAPAETRFICLTDMDVAGVETQPLHWGWPGWWSKMELFSPALRGDLLYLDLDSTVVGDLRPLLTFGRVALMQDVYRPHGLQSSVMYLPAQARAEIWGPWVLNPVHWMRKHRRGGDQAFLERFWINRARRWQADLPGHVLSYKADLRGGMAPLPSAARVVAYHGQPRPWTSGDVYAAA